MLERIFSYLERAGGPVTASRVLFDLEDPSGLTEKVYYR